MIAQKFLGIGKVLDIRDMDRYISNIVFLWKRI